MAGLCLMLAACTSDDSNEPAVPDTPETPEAPVDPTRPRVNIVSRAEGGATDTAVPLQAGLYMVNRLGEEAEELLPTGNYVDNLLLTYGGGVWTSSAPIYWLSLFMPADFYAYAPRQEAVADARQLTVSVATDQRTDEAAAQSDFLWGTVQNQMPTTEGFDLLLTHQLSRLTIVVADGAGFAEGELKDNDVSVTIGGTRTSGTADLLTGTVTAANGSTADGSCHADGNLTYTAILLPQQVPFANLIQVDWRGNKYTLQNSFTLEPSRQYTLTVRLKKTQSGLDIGIDGWDIIEEDFGGTIGG